VGGAAATEPGEGEGRALTKCLVQGGEAAPPALPVGVHFGGRWEAGTCEPQEPPEPSLPLSLKAEWGGVLRSRQEGGERKEIILCSLAHLLTHI